MTTHTSFQAVGYLSDCASKTLTLATATYSPNTNHTTTYGFVQCDNLRPFVQIQRPNTGYVRPQVAVNTWTLDTHEDAQVEACPVRICEKIKLIYPYNKKETLLQVKKKGMRKVAKYSWYITGVDRGEMCNVGNLQQKAANMNIIARWSDCRYILDASQSAQWVLPGTRERMVCIELLSTELSSLDLDFLISFPCNRNQELRTKFWRPKYKICLGITWSEPQ